MRRLSSAIVGIIVLGTLSALAPAGQSDVSGSWELVVQTSRGEMTSTVRFVQEGEKLKVNMTGPRGSETSGEGSIKDAEIRWTIVRVTSQGERTVVYKGTVKDGTMSGQAEISDGRSAPWKAVKR